jgi:hypothetical protein
MPEEGVGATPKLAKNMQEIFFGSGPKNFFGVDLLGLCKLVRFCGTKMMLTVTKESSLHGE